MLKSHPGPVSARPLGLLQPSSYDRSPQYGVGPYEVPHARHLRPSRYRTQPCRVTYDCAPPVPWHHEQNAEQQVATAPLSEHGMPVRLSLQSGIGCTTTQSDAGVPPSGDAAWPPVPALEPPLPCPPVPALEPLFPCPPHASNDVAVASKTATTDRPPLVGKNFIGQKRCTLLPGSPTARQRLAGQVRRMSRTLGGAPASSG